MKTWALIDASGVATFLTDSDTAPAWPDHTAVDVTGVFMGPGWTLTDGAWVAPVKPADPTQYLIDVGPFFDRFGAAKMPLLVSTNATVKALIADIQVRKWIDLQRPDVGQAIDALIALGVSGMTPALKTAILTTPVTAEENLALRKLYFS